jgi:NAD(P)-dependent dehydrogenase (short-subunit alcohol dehydrogenase family)
LASLSKLRFGCLQAEQRRPSIEPSCGFSAFILDRIGARPARVGSRRFNSIDASRRIEGSRKTADAHGALPLGSVDRPCREWGRPQPEDGRYDLHGAHGDKPDRDHHYDAEPYPPPTQADAALLFVVVGVAVHGPLDRRHKRFCQCARRGSMAEAFLGGQVAIVTGGGKGIGRAIALELAGRGARVVVSGREERALGETVGEIAHAGGQARHLAGDVRDEAHVCALVARATETWGRLDIVVANAGRTATARLGEGASSSEARSVMETNLFGTYYLFDAALVALGSPGRLVAISSVLGKFGAAGQGAYCASKAGLHGLVRAVALEVASRQITCNAVCPGWVDTAMARSRLSSMAASAKMPVEDVVRAAGDEVPIGRFVQPEEVARFVAFLCSPAASAITGQALSICGGSTAFAG